MRSRFTNDEDRDCDVPGAESLRGLGTELLFVVLAALAVAAGEDNQTNADAITDLKVLHLRANRGDVSNDFVTGNHGIDARTPSIIHLVNVCIASKEANSELSNAPSKRTSIAH